MAIFLLIPPVSRAVVQLKQIHEPWPAFVVSVVPLVVTSGMPNFIYSR